MNPPRLEMVHRAQADTDYTVAYIDRRAAAISEKRGGGHYAYVEDGEYIYNQYARQYVKDGRWQSTLAGGILRTARHPRRCRGELRPPTGQRR